MKRIVLIAAISLIACVSVSAETAKPATCKAQAAEKKLAGAAATSFLKKCETDAKAGCEKESKDQKLSGAAASSHTKKCTADAVGT